MQRLPRLGEICSDLSPASLRDASGAPIGLVAWTGVLTASVLILALLLAYRPLAASLLAGMAPVAALLLLDQFLPTSPAKR
jgi:Protein of unknown function (DUF3325)